nr:DUF3883 domain-containing protein [Tsuneonella aeria]
MSAFTAAIGICRYLRDHPGTAAEDAALALRRSDADFAGADFTGGLTLVGRLPEDLALADISVFIREALSALIEVHRPWWIKLSPYGRQRLASALTLDEQQTFRAAGLYDPQPSSEAIEWWDRLAAQARADQDERLGAQGRRAELLSLNHEIERMKTEGIQLAPVWTALDDNAAGYDIRSYSKTLYGIANLLIEVKSTSRTPPRIILTRGEWEAAQKYQAAYTFHIWQFPDETLTIRTVQDISAHIPDDRGEGAWQKVEIII